MDLFKRDKKEKRKLAEVSISPESHGARGKYEREEGISSKGEDAGAPKAEQIYEEASQSSVSQAQSAPGAGKSVIYKQIEEIMQDDLDNLYSKLDPYVQREFKKRGEETASLIERLIVSAKVTAKRVFQLILSWLKIIPHVNKYYLQQEAKIKSDKILRMTHDDKNI